METPDLPSPARFWDRRASAYAKKPVPDEDAYARTLDRVRAHLSPSDSVLELGCGTGTTALALAGSARAILATDYSAEMIGIATTKARALGVNNVSFRRCTPDDAALAVESFDVVMAMNVLHLLADLPAQLQRVGELVRRDGLFISKTPCIGDQGLAMRILISAMRTVGLAPYVNFVTERSLAAEITRTGFALQETSMYPKRSLFIVARKN